MSVEAVVIARASANDLDAIDAIEKAAHLHPWTRAQLQAELSTAQSHFYVLRAHEAIVAYAVVWCVVDDIELLNIASAPTAQRRGYAQMLLQHIIDTAHGSEAKRVMLEVRLGNTAARALYERMGFVIVGRRAGYYANPSEDALLYDLSLNA